MRSMLLRSVRTAANFSLERTSAQRLIGLLARSKSGPKPLTLERWASQETISVKPQASPTRAGVRFPAYLVPYACLECRKAISGTTILMR